MYIDMHVHTTTHRLWGLHVERADIEDLRAIAKKYHVARMVVLATYFPFKGRGLSNRELLKRIAGDDLFVPFGSLDAMNNLQAGADELYRLAYLKLIAGLKLYPGYQKFNLEDLHPVCEIAAEFNLPIMMHTGSLHHCCPRSDREAGKFRCGPSCPLDSLGYLSNPLTLSVLPNHYPDVKFIFSHMGCPHYDDMVTVMRNCPNVYTDISGQFTSGGPYDNPKSYAEVKDTMKKIIALPNGINRLLFGTDFPIQSYDSTIAMLRSLELSSEQEMMIRVRNAAKLLKINNPFCRG